MACSCRDKPQGRQSDWCATYRLPPAEKAPIWKDKLLIFSVRSSSHCLRQRISPTSKPNPSLSIKFIEIHRRKTPFSCEYQQPCAFIWCFSFFEDRERWVKGGSSYGPVFQCGTGLHRHHSSCSNWDHQPAVHGGQPGVKSWLPLSSKYCGQTPGSQINLFSVKLKIPVNSSCSSS